MGAKGLTDQECIDNVKHEQKHESIDRSLVNLVDVIASQQNMININRESIQTLTEILKRLKEELKCLKQQS